MKLLVTLLFIAAVSICNAQQTGGTIVRQSTVTDTSCPVPKTAGKEGSYQRRVRAQLHSTDTVGSTHDSVVIRYFSKAGVLLKRVVKTYNRPDCQSFEEVQYFNEKGLLEYVEFWRCDCRTQKDIGEDEKIFRSVLSWYMRVVYDSCDRKVADISIYPSSIPGALKYEYRYDSTGKVTAEFSRIAAKAFWD